MISSYPTLAPQTDALSSLTRFLGTIRVELSMQWRRLGFWLAFSVIPLLLLTLRNPAYTTIHQLPASILFPLALASTVRMTIQLGAIIAALVVADRLSRDRQLGMRDLQLSSPQSLTSYLLAKFAGNLFAVLVPIYLINLLMAVSYIVITGVTTELLPATLISTTLAGIPAFSVVVALVIVLSTLLPSRLVQIGFPIIWLYSVLSPFNWTTIASTIFNPSGKYVLETLYPVKYGKEVLRFTSSDMLFNITALIGATIIFMLLTVAIHTYKNYREAIS